MVRSNPTPVHINLTPTTFPKVPTKRKLEMQPEENHQIKRKRIEEFQETLRTRKLKQKVQNLEKMVINLKCDNINLKDLAKSRKKKVSNLNKKCNRLKKKVASLKEIIQDITNKKLINEEQCQELKSLGDESDIVMQYNGSKKEYSQNMRRFAITLHYYSPRAYTYVRLGSDKHKFLHYVFLNGSSHFFLTLFTYVIFVIAFSTIK